MVDTALFKSAIKASVPVFLGYLPTSFVFGLMMTTAGYHTVLAVIMSIVIYAGAGQYLAVTLLTGGVGLVQVAVMTFLINSKHLFYGLSLLEDYKNAGWRKPYLIFSLTDEAYALLTQPAAYNVSDRIKYCFYVSASTHCMWIFGTLLGAMFGTVVSFNAAGMEFALTALFIVILIEQMKSHKNKLPFVIGSVCAIIAFIAVGRDNMLLVGCVLIGISLVLFRNSI